jgi:hypothetical protein
VTVQKPYEKKQLKRWWKAFGRAGWNVQVLARNQRPVVPATTWKHRIDACKHRLGVKIPAHAKVVKRPPINAVPIKDLRTLWQAFEAHGFNEAHAARALELPRSTFQKRLEMAKARLDVKAPDRHNNKDEALIRILKRPGGAALEEAAAALGITPGQALDRITALGKKHVNLHRSGQNYVVTATPASGISGGRQVVHKSDKNGWYRFGLVADSHIGSKYARTEVLNSIYDEFQRQGIERVYHCGNMIDGFKSGVNDHDITVAGMDDQIELLAKDYPRRKGITTYAVSGDDHEGWFAQKMGIDIGKRIQQTMHDRGRTDWVDLGYMECFITLKSATTGKEGQLLVCHPGGGSSYADSYVVQKIVESYEGGEKPGIAVFGHYHKNLTGEYRNVWYCLVPCTQDQTPWARKKRLRYVIGGQIVEAWQRPETGAFERFKVEQLRYFNRGYYNDRWKPAGLPVLPARTREAQPRAS